MVAYPRELLPSRVIEIEQLELRLDDLQIDEGTVQSKPARKRAEATGRKPGTKHLELEECGYRPEHEVCPDCGGAPNALCEDLSEQLELLPGDPPSSSESSLRVLQLHRACGSAESTDRSRSARSSPAGTNRDLEVRRARAAVSRQSVIYARELRRARARHDGFPGWARSARCVIRFTAIRARRCEGSALTSHCPGTSCRCCRLPLAPRRFTEPTISVRQFLSTRYKSHAYALFEIRNLSPTIDA